MCARLRGSDRGAYQEAQAGSPASGAHDCVVVLERQLSALVGRFEKLVADSLPKTAPLPGCVIAQYRTVKGKSYGPYWFRTWRDEGGRQRKAYVRPEDVEAVRAACALHRRLARSRGRAHRRAMRRWGRDWERFADVCAGFMERSGNF